MKFLISGNIKKKLKFKMEIIANNESYAKELLYIKLGSKQKLKKTSINIDEIKKMD